MTKQRPKNFLYVATDGKLFKIGITNNPAQREQTLRIRFIQVWRRPWARALELSIKHIFAWAAARGTEWFAVSEAEMLYAVRRVVRIEDDDRAIKRGLEPSKRPADGEPSFMPPFELTWLKTARS